MLGSRKHKRIITHNLFRINGFIRECRKNTLLFTVKLNIDILILPTKIIKKVLLLVNFTEGESYI